MKRTFESELISGNCAQNLDGKKIHGKKKYIYNFKINSLGVHVYL